MFDKENGSKCVSQGNIKVTSSVATKNKTKQKYNSCIYITVFAKLK